VGGWPAASAAGRPDTALGLCEYCRAAGTDTRKFAVRDAERNLVRAFANGEVFFPIGQLAVPGSSFLSFCRQADVPVDLGDGVGDMVDRRAMVWRGRGVG
jgi:hypothetical protein